MFTESIPVIRIARTRLEGFKRLFIVIVPVGLNYQYHFHLNANVRTRFELSNWTVIFIAYLQKRPISRVSAVGEKIAVTVSGVK
jgi:hypothetical protein